MVPPPRRSPGWRWARGSGGHPADGGGHGLLDEERVRGRPACGLGHRRRSTSVMAEGTQTTRGRLKRPTRAVQQQPDHPLRHVEVGDRALAEGALGDDVAGVRPIICQASWPIASTSRVRVLRAITVGSLRTMRGPARRPGCWRCRGRWSRATTASTSVGSDLAVAQGQRLHLTPKLSMLASNVVGGRFRRYSTVARPQKSPPRSGGRRRRPRNHPVPASTMCCASSPSSRRPSDSRFQMGTERFRVSMQNRAAAKASSRCGADTATTTTLSPISRTLHPVQQGDAADHGPAHPRLLGHVARSGTTCSS